MYKPTKEELEEIGFRLIEIKNFRGEKTCEFYRKDFGYDYLDFEHLQDFVLTLSDGEYSYSDRKLNIESKQDLLTLISILKE